MAPMAGKIENRGPELMGVNVFFLTSAIIAVALRCYVRAGLVKAFGRDDWLMLLALVFFICYSSASITGVHYGTGRHYKDLTEDNIHKAMESWWYCYLFYALSMITSKMSIAYFLLRIATKKAHIWIIYAAMLFTVIAGVVFFFVVLFQCMPIARFWDREIAGTCIDVNVVIGLAFLYSSFSVISDLTFAILPGFLVWGLQLKTRAKLSLIPLLVMGCVASSAVVVRFAFLTSLRDPDFLWATLDIAIWSSVEQGLAITAGSLATIRPLLKLVGYKLGMSTNPSRMRMTDDVARRPSAFMNASQQQHQPKNGPRGNGDEDAYGLTIIPCKCCGNFKCEKGGGQEEEVAAVSPKSKGRRRSSLGFPTARIKKDGSGGGSGGCGDDEPRSLANVKSVSESEEELNAGRARGDSQVHHHLHHDGLGVVPKSFMS